MIVRDLKLALICCGTLFLSLQPDHAVLAQSSNSHISANSARDSEPANSSPAPKQTVPAQKPAENPPAPAHLAQNTDPVNTDIKPDQNQNPAGQAPPALADKNAGDYSDLESKKIAPREIGLKELKKRPQPTSFAPSAWQTVGSLLIVLALIILFTYLLRRFSLNKNFKRANHGIEILARNNLNSKQSLCLVKLGGRMVLIGLSPNHMAALQTIDDPGEIALVQGQLEKNQPNSISNTFGKWFYRQSQLFQESDQNNQELHQPWNQARGELSTLLDKVKGLSRIRFRP